jgi:hypothetical protein
MYERDISTIKGACGPQLLTANTRCLVAVAVAAATVDIRAAVAIGGGGYASGGAVTGVGPVPSVVEEGQLQTHRLTRREDK